MAFLDNIEIGKRLKEKRKPTNLSARKFAMKAGVDQSQYTKIEKGELPITENIMDKLIKEYGFDKNSILHGANVPRETNNHSIALNKPQHGDNSQKQGLDTDKEISRLMDQQLTVSATLSVFLSEIAALIAKVNDRSHASAFSQIQKDISIELERLKTLRDKKQYGD